MTAHFARTARLLIAILAVYGFVLHGFGRDAAAVARIAPQGAALCMPGIDGGGDHDTGRACDLHCLGALVSGGVPPASSAMRIVRFAIVADIPSRQPVAVLRQPLRLADVRGPPQLI